MVYKFFDKKSSSLSDKSAAKCSGFGFNQNEQLAKELHKRIIRKLKKRQVYSSSKENIWNGDLSDMQLIIKFNKGLGFLLLCVIDLFSKYVWVVPLKDKKGITITSAFQKNLHESKRKPNKRWVNKTSEFCNSSIKLWLQDNNIEIHSAQNEVQIAHS